MTMLKREVNWLPGSCYGRGLTLSLLLDSHFCVHGRYFKRILKTGLRVDI
jgi:hypothetical protein